MTLYVAFLAVLAVGYAVGRWRCHAEAAEAFAHAARVVDELTGALGGCAAICQKYADESAAQDTLAEPPNESIVKEQWVQDIESSCVTLGAEDCAMLIGKHVQATHDRIKELAP